MPKQRLVSIGIRLTDEEHAALWKAAQERKQTLSEYVRSKLLMTLTLARP